MGKKKKSSFNETDLIALNKCIALLETAKEFILDIQTQQKKPSDLFYIISDLHGCALELKNVSNKLSLINNQSKKN